ncbi:MAG: hypothetical protein Q7S52_00760 [bacterium]|nr:hypothetical protein [bacterium]
MDIAERIADILTRVAQIRYLKYEPCENPHIAIAFGDEKEIHFEHFAESASCRESWEALVQMLVTNCSSPFIGMANTLFQPAHLAKVMRFEDERGYFVALLFTGGHNIAWGYHKMAERTAAYRTLLQMLGEEAGDENLNQTIQ